MGCCRRSRWTPHLLPHRLSLSVIEHRFYQDISEFVIFGVEHISGLRPRGAEPRTGRAFEVLDRKKECPLTGTDALGAYNPRMPSYPPMHEQTLIEAPTLR